MSYSADVTTRAAFPAVVSRRRGARRSADAATRAFPASPLPAALRLRGVLGGRPTRRRRRESLRRGSRRSAGASGRPGRRRLLMWNPPWTLPLVLPFGLLPPHLARVLWLLLSFAAVLAAADAAWIDYGGPPGKRGIAWLLAFSFMPTFLTLYLGQIAAALLAGAVLFLRFQRREHDFRAGAATLLLAVKPHLFLFFWLALLLWAVDRRRWARAGGRRPRGRGGDGGGACCSDPALLLDQYRQVLTATPPVQYRSPTLGTVLRRLFDEEPQFRPAIPRAATGNRVVRADVVTPPPHVGLGRAAAGRAVRLLADGTVRGVAVRPDRLARAAAPRGRFSLRRAALRPASPALGLYLTANVAAVACVLGKVDFFWWIWLAPALLLTYVVALSTGTRPVGSVRLEG